MRSKLEHLSKNSSSKGVEEEALSALQKENEVKGNEKVSMSIRRRGSWSMSIASQGNSRLLCPIQAKEPLFLRS